MLDLSPHAVRRIENGRYWLWGIEAPTDVCAAYERLWSNRRVSQRDGDLLMAWLVENTLVRGDFSLATKLRDALERLGWRPPAS